MSTHAATTTAPEAKHPKLVLIESPLSGSVRRNMAYAKAAMLDSLQRGEAPFVMHLHYPLVLDDDNPAERAKGIEAGLSWGRKAELTAAYVDFGTSDGMRIGIARAKEEGRPVELRTIDFVWPPKDK